MLPAAMAKPPEHDFAPSWLKIPQGNPISHHPSGDHRSTSKSQFHQDLRPRRAPHDSYHGYAPRPSYSRGLGPPHGKDERRPYPHRQHSADDLITMADRMTDSMSLNSPGLFSPQSGFSSESFFPNANQYRGRFGPGTREGSSHGREEGCPGRNQTRGARHSGGRQRYPSGNSHTGSKERPLHPEHRKDSFHPRSSHSEDRSKTSDHVGIRLGKENVGERGKDVGGEKDSSALSRQDFPSLSGDKDEVKETAKPPQPTGAWEKRPATKNIGGRHYKLTQKTTFKDSKDNTPKTSLLSPRSNTTSNPSGNSLKLSSQTSTVPPPPASTRGIIPIKSTNGGGNTILLKVTSSPKVTSRKPVTKEPTIVKDKLGAIPNSNGSNGSSSSSNSVPSPHTEPPPAKPSKPTPSQPVEVPSPRLILGKPKKGPKSDFIRELRRSTTADGQTCFENGGLEHEDFNYNRASSLNNDLEENEKNLYDNGINSVEITTSLENGYLDSNESWEDTKTSHNTPKLSSSLEAEQRLLREMGWHEHSDNEEGYAPITEDERQEFKLRSQQLKRNGFTKPNLNSIMISSSLPVNAFLQTVIDPDDDCSCSSSDSSEDED